MAENLQEYLKKFGITTPPARTVSNAPTLNRQDFLKSYGIDESLVKSKQYYTLQDEFQKMVKLTESLYVMPKPVNYDSYTPVQSAPVVQPKTNFFQAVGNTFLSGLANLVRTTFTTDKNVTSSDKNVISSDNKWTQIKGMTNIDIIKNPIKQSFIADTVSAVLPKANEYLKTQEQSFAKKADLTNQSGFTRVIANAISSTPVSLLTRMPYASGWIIMGNQSFQNSIESSKTRVANGDNISETAMTVNAIGSAAIEIGSEMMFGLFKKIGGTKAVGSVLNATWGYLDGVLGKGITKIGRTAMGSFVKNIAQVPVAKIGIQIGQQAVEEGSEEIVGGIGSGILAKLTTDKGADLFSFNDRDSLITFMGLTEAFLTGAVAGGGITALRAMPSFTNRNNWVNGNANKIVGELTTPDIIGYVNAVETDTKTPQAQEFIADASKNFIENTKSPEEIAQVQNLIDVKINGKTYTPNKGSTLTGVRTTPAISDNTTVQTVPTQPIVTTPPLNAAQAPATSSVRKVNKVPVGVVKSVETAVEPIRPLSKRVVGDTLLNAQDLIKEIKNNGGKTDNNGYVTLYHKTSKVNADNIVNTKIMSAKEDGVFFSTKSDGMIKDFGDTALTFKVPVEKLVLDDVFGTEAHLRLSLANKNVKLNVSNYLISETSPSTELESVLKGQVTPTAPEAKANIQKVVTKVSEPIRTPVYDASLNIDARIEAATGKSPKEIQALINTAKSTIQDLVDKINKTYPSTPQEFTIHSNLKSDLGAEKYILHELERVKEKVKIAETSNAKDKANKSTKATQEVKQDLTEVTEPVKGAVETKVDKLKTEQVKFAEQNRFMWKNDIETANKIIKGNAMKVAYEIRKLRQGDSFEKVEGGLTDKELSVLKQKQKVKEPVKKTPTIIQLAEEKPLTNREFAEKNGEYKKTNAEINADAKAEIEKESVKQKSSLETIANTPDSGDTSSGENLGIIFKGNKTRTSNEETIPIKGVTPEVIATLKKNSTFPSNNATIKDSVIGAYKYTYKNVALGSVTVSNKFGDYKRAVRLFRGSANAASAKTIEVIQKSYGVVKGKERDLLQKALLFFDMEENIKLGMKFKPRQDIKTVDQLYEIVDDIRATINKPEYSLIKKAYDARKSMLSAVNEELIAAGDRVGKDYRYIRKREYYVYNAIYERYVAENAKNINKSTAKLYARKGSENEYISNPIVSDYLSLVKEFKMIRRLEVLAEVIKLDKSADIKYDHITGDEILPEGYVRVTKNEIIGDVDITNDIERNAHKMALEVMKQDGISLNSKAGKKIIKRANGVDLSSSVVIPLEVYENVVDEFTKKKSNEFEKWSRKTVSLWKWTKIRSPFVVWKYNARNMYGDLEITVMVDPKTALEMPSAIWQEYQYYYKNNRENLMVLNHMEKTGGLSGMSIQTMGEVDKIPDFNYLISSKSPKDISINVMKKIWKTITMEKFTGYREQILRFASYSRLTKATMNDLKKRGIFSGSYSEYLKLKASDIPDGYKPSKGYMVSSRPEVDSIDNIDDKMIRLSEDMLGAYNNVSVAGVAVADHAAPFFRFREISMKRLIQLGINSFYSEGTVINNRGKSIAQKAGIAGKVGAVGLMKLGKAAILLSLLYVATSAANNLFAGEDEKKLPEDIRKQPHITIPSWIFGDKSRVFYLSNIGIASELLSALGVQFGTQDVLDVVTGKKTLTQIANEFIKPNMASIIFSIDPVLVQAFELASGKKGYNFDPEHPSQIRDSMEFIFQQAGFGQVYTVLAGLPKNKSTILDTVIANNVATGDVAMWAVYDMEDEYRKENEIDPQPDITYDKTSMKWKKSNAAFYYKLAIKLKDTNAIAKYMAEYVGLGGDDKSMDSSLQTMKPLQFMAADDRRKMIKQMTPDERETYDKAVAYYEEIRAVDDKEFK